MISIREVSSYRSGDSQTWSGCIRTGGKYRASSESAHIKKYFKERYPLSKKNLSVIRWKPYSHFYDFSITFQDEAEEAEFIMTFKNLEETTL